MWFSLTFPWLFQSVQNSLTFPWLENAFPFFQVFQVFQSEWEPCDRVEVNLYLRLPRHFLAILCVQWITYEFTWTCPSRGVTDISLARMKIDFMLQVILFIFSKISACLFGQGSTCPTAKCILYSTLAESYDRSAMWKNLHMQFFRYIHNSVYMAWNWCSVCDRDSMYQTLSW